MKTFFQARPNFDLLRYYIKRQKNFLVLFLILAFASFPVPVFVKFLVKGDYNYLMNQSEPLSLAYYGVQGMLIFVSVILMMIVPFVFFNYLYSKKSVDVFHSLPISRSNLFINYSLLSYLFVIIPFALAYWSGVGLLTTLFHIPFTFGLFTNFIRICLILAAVQAPTIFVIMNTGTLSDAVIYTAILFIAPFVAFGAFQTFSSNYIFGVGASFSEGYMIYLSPAFALITAPFNYFQNITFTGAAFYWIIISIISNIISCKLYESIKSENSQQPFTNNWFFPFVTSLFVMFLLIFLFSLGNDSHVTGIWNFLAPQFVLIPILLGYVFYLILDFVRHRSARSIKKSSINYGIVLLITIFITTVLFTTQGFGYAWKVPDLNNIKQVSLKLGDTNTPTILEFSENINVTLKDKHDIEIIRNFHEMIALEEHDQFSALKSNKITDQYYQRQEITFTYHLTRGAKSERTFRMTPEQGYKLSKLMQLNLIKQEAFPITKPLTKLSEVNIYNSLFTQKYKPKEIEGLKIAIETDLMNIDYQNPIASGLEIYAYIIIEDREEYQSISAIDSRFTQTVELLKATQTEEFQASSYDINQYIDKELLENKAGIKLFYDYIGVSTQESVPYNEAKEDSYSILLPYDTSEDMKFWTVTLDSYPYMISAPLK